MEVIPALVWSLFALVISPDFEKVDKVGAGTFETPAECLAVKTELYRLLLDSPTNVYLTCQAAEKPIISWRPKDLEQCPKGTPGSLYSKPQKAYLCWRS